MHGLTKAFILLAGIASLGCYSAQAGEPHSFPVHLPPGKAPGTFHYSESVQVTFSQKPEYPVDYVLEDYAHKEVFRTAIRSDAPAVVQCDLPPGSYQVRYHMNPKARADYLDADGSSVFIFANGTRAYFQGGGFSYLAPAPGRDEAGKLAPIFLRKIELLSPPDHARIKDKTITLHWKAIPGISSYFIILYPIEHLDHPDSTDASARYTKLVKGTQATLSIGDQPDDDLRPAAYAWAIFDGDWDNSGGDHVARSNFQVFGSAPLPDQYSHKPGESVSYDELVEPRLGLRLEQLPRMVADSCRNYLLITAVGGNTPAFLAGLKPGDKIASCKGKPVWNVGDFHRDLQALAPGTPVVLGIVYDKEGDAKPLTWPCRLLLR